MNTTILKSLLLIFVILINIFAFYAHIPTGILLKMHLALAIAILVIIFIFKNDMLNLLILWFFLVLFKASGGAIKLPFLPDIFPERIIMVLIALIFIIELMLKKREILKFSAAEIAMMLFSLYLIFSIIIAGTYINEEKGFSPGMFLNTYGFPFVIFFISKNIIDNESKIRKFFFFLSFIGLYLGLTSIFEYFQLKQFVFPRYIMSEWIGGFYGRARGPFLQPAVNGTVMGILIFVSASLLLHENKGWKKYFYVISIICLLMGILFTLTRSCWVATLAAIFTMPILIPRVRKLFFISLVTITILSLFIMKYSEIRTRGFADEGDLYKKKATLVEKIVFRTTTESSVYGRVNLYKAAFILFLDSPFFGHGYGAFQQAKQGYGINLQLLYSSANEARIAGIHDTTMSLLVDLGLVGVILYLFIMIYILNICRKLYNKLPREIFSGKDLLASSVGMFIVYLVSSQMFDMRFFLFPNCLFFCVAGILVGLYQRMLRSEINFQLGKTA